MKAAITPMNVEMSTTLEVFTLIKNKASVIIENDKLMIPLYRLILYLIF